MSNIMFVLFLLLSNLCKVANSYFPQGKYDSHLKQILTYHNHSLWAATVNTCCFFCFRSASCSFPHWCWCSSSGLSLFFIIIISKMFLRTVTISDHHFFATASLPGCRRWRWRCAGPTDWRPPWRGWRRYWVKTRLPSRGWWPPATATTTTPAMRGRMPWREGGGGGGEMSEQCRREVVVPWLCQTEKFQ